jgi:hypothetical protein
MRADLSAPTGKWLTQFTRSLEKARAHHRVSREALPRFVHEPQIQTRWSVFLVAGAAKERSRSPKIHRHGLAPLVHSSQVVAADRSSRVAGLLEERKDLSEISAAAQTIQASEIITAESVSVVACSFEQRLGPTGILTNAHA